MQTIWIVQGDSDGAKVKWPVAAYPSEDAAAHHQREAQAFVLNKFEECEKNHPGYSYGGIIAILRRIISPWDPNIEWDVGVGYSVCSINLYGSMDEFILQTAAGHTKVKG